MHSTKLTCQSSTYVQVDRGSNFVAQRKQLTLHCTLSGLAEELAATKVQELCQKKPSPLLTILQSKGKSSCPKLTKSLAAQDNAHYKAHEPDY